MINKTNPAQGKAFLGPNPPSADVGVGDFARQVEMRWPELLLAVGELERLVQKARRPAAPEPLTKILYHLSVIAANSLGAVTVLARSGYGYDAMRLARGMFEAAVNAAYLNRHPELADDFIDYRWVRHKKNQDYIRQVGHASTTPESVVQEVNTRFSEVAPRFKNRNGGLRNSWCAVSLHDRAIDVGLGYLYPTFYAIASGIHHAEITGLINQSDSTGYEVDVAPSFESVDTALLVANLSVLKIVESLNSSASLELDDDIKAVSCVIDRAYIKWGEQRADSRGCRPEP